MPPQQQLIAKGQSVKGDITGSGYVVTRRLGEGQFAEVWEVRQAGGADLRFALKLEKFPERKSVLHETKVLGKLPGKCDQVVSVIDTGYHGKHFFMIMELLGDTLFDIRKQAGGRVDLPTVKAVGLSTLAAIEGLHSLGFIHRDIKPANFVINPPNAAASRGKWVLIDFGLARKYVDEDGAHLTARSDASFRGSTAYASVHAHRNEDLSRRDDLWSWFYMLLELVEGCLLWRVDRDDPRDHTDKQWVLHEKEKCWDHPHLLARGTLPDALLSVHNHIKGLSFTDTPNYDHLRQCLQQLPDEKQQLTALHNLLTPQAAAAAAGGGANVLLNGAAAAAALQQQHWDNSPLLFGQQQQQQQQVSPLLLPGQDGAGAGVGQLLPPSATAAAGGKRPRVSSGGEGAAAAAGDASLAKRQRQQQQQQQALGRSSSPAAAGDADAAADGSKQGSLGTPAAAAAAGGRLEQPSQQQLVAHANGIISSQPLQGQQLQQQQQQQQQLSQQAGVGGVGVGGGRASEISELLISFNREAAQISKAATQQAVAGLCALPPLEAVCAISMTLDKLVKQSDTDCLPAVSQLLLDLAAFAASGAAEASSAAAAAAQRQQQQPPQR